ALYMHFLLLSLHEWRSIVGFSALLIAVNARIVNVFSAVEYWFSEIKVTAIVLFIVLASFIVLRASGALAGAGGAAAAAVGFHNYTAYGGFLPKGVWGVWVAVIIAIFSY